MTSFQDVGRQQQGHFRDNAASVTDSGRQPLDPKGRRNSHLLALRSEMENLIPSIRDEGGISDFFKARGIHWWRSSRSGDALKRDVPTRNLASSQISCVNFLFPLAQDHEAVTALLRAIDRDVVRALPIAYPSPNGEKLESLIEFEWEGISTSLEGTPVVSRGANATSADALIVGGTSEGQRRAYLLEWKYVEAYEPDEDKGAGKEGTTRLSRYSKLYTAAQSPFDPTIPIRAWLYEPFYQIVRLLLLGMRMRDTMELEISDYVVAVVCPEENTKYRKTITSPKLRARFPTARNIEEVVNCSLREPRRFRMLSQAFLLSAVAATGDQKLKPWLDYHRERYGWTGSAGPR